MILLIDNYDSFTYNLVQLLRRTVDVQVVRNDTEDVDTLLARGPQGIVISPGPGRPEQAGVCMDLIAKRPEIPMLGVCLGHQCLAATFGATVERAPYLMHGKTSQVSYRPDRLFEGLPNPFQATRYHSLAVTEESLPRNLSAIAWSEDGTVMALRHKELPYWGVQFHPESVLTPVGESLLQNYLQICGYDQTHDSEVEAASTNLVPSQFENVSVLPVGTIPGPWANGRAQEFELGGEAW